MVTYRTKVVTAEVHLKLIQWDSELNFLHVKNMTASVFTKSMYKVPKEVYMKKILFLVAAVVLCFQANAKDIERKRKMTTCERLTKQAEENCTESMCEEADAQDVECVKDGDFYEGLQICVYDSELPDLIAAYNKKHAGRNLVCRD